MIKRRLTDSALLAIARFRSPFVGSYSSYDEAAQIQALSTYENTHVVDVVAAKTTRYRRALLDGKSVADINESNIRLAFAISLAASRHTGVITVVDFGGACGTHYFLARRLLSKHIMLDWRVVETTAMSAVGRDRFASKELSFYDSLTESTHGSNGVDLLFCANALQYLSDPLAGLKNLLAVHASIACIVSLATHKGSQSTFTLQRSRLSSNGPGTLPGLTDSTVVYPYSALPESNVERIVVENHSLLARLDEPRYLYQKNIGRISYKGYLLSSIGETN